MKGTEIDETELLLQINNPCPEHDYKFLLYYCFDCGKSICSECFTNGIHKGHKIQDKCFYLLPSKYLVDKMLENLSKKPYEDYKISADLNDYQNKLNNVVFSQLFEMLKKVQKKCNELVDKYNIINSKSLDIIRDSVRDIKISCIKALDECKDLINIKDIVNNNDTFIDFDRIYKDMGKKQKEKFKENLVKFQELNKNDSILVQSLINDRCQAIQNILNKAIDNKQYEEIEKKINLKMIKPVNRDDVINQLSDKKIKMLNNKKLERKTMINNYNRLVNNNSECLQSKLEKNANNQGRNTFAGDNVNSFNYSEENNINNNIGQNLNEKSKNLNMGFSINQINNNKNYSVDSTLKKPLQVNQENISPNKNNITQINNTNTNYSNNPTINDFNNNSNNHLFLANRSNNNSNINLDNSSFQQENNLNQNINQSFQQQKNIFDLQSNNNENQVSFNDIEKNNIENTNSFTEQIKGNSLLNNQQNNENNINQKEKDVNIESNDKPFKNIFGSILDDNKNKINPNLFNTNSNKKENNNLNLFSGNIVSPIDDNRIFNPNNEILSNNSSFNNDINNMNNAQNNQALTVINLNKGNNSEQNSFSFENSNNNNNNQLPINENSKNLVLSSPFSQIITNNKNQLFNINNNYNINASDGMDNNMNNNINNNMPSISAQKKNLINIMDSKYLSGLAQNCKTILEEANESESDIKNQKERNINIEYYLTYYIYKLKNTKKVTKK